MRDWTTAFSEDLWLKPDHVGAQETEFVAKALGLRSEQAVLDAPCGAGRIAIHIAHLGCRVTGIDLRRSFTERAAARFRAEGRQGRFISMDLREMAFREEFDAAFSWLGSFGYFEDDENLDVLKRYAMALRKNGRLLVDQVNREAMLRHFRASHNIGGHTVKNRWNERDQRVESDWIAEGGDEAERHNHTSIRLYTPTQMRRLFALAGLEVSSQETMGK